MYLLMSLCFKARYESDIIIIRDFKLKICYCQKENNYTIKYDLEEKQDGK